MSKTHNFNDYVNRVDTDAWKWDGEFPGTKFPMGCADTDYNAPIEVINALNKRLENHVFAYNGYECLSTHASSIEGYYKRRHQMQVDPSHVVYTSGLMVAFKLAMDAYSSAGDNVIIQSPVYHSFRITIEKAGRHVSDNELIFDEENNSFSIDFENLEKRAQDPRTKMMIICNPMPPVGKQLSSQELVKIYNICKENNVLLISDEVHGGIYYDGKKHISLHSISDDIKNNSIVMSASGKTFNIHTFYASYLIIPNDKLRSLYEVAFQSHHMDINEFGVLANIAAYSECDYYIDGLVEYLQGNLDYMRNFFENELPSVKLVDADATYLAWLNFREWEMTSDELHDLFMKHGVGMSKGSNFGRSGDGFMRMNIACHRETLIGALEVIKQAHSTIK